jgi:hypothetical protein
MPRGPGRRRGVGLLNLLLIGAWMFLDAAYPEPASRGAAAPPSREDRRLSRSRKRRRRAARS